MRRGRPREEVEWMRRVSERMQLRLRGLLLDLRAMHFEGKGSQGRKLTMASPLPSHILGR